MPSNAAEDIQSEEARLEALLEYDVLDTAAEPVFDDLVALAANQCEAPMALISLVDRDRQWFKSRHGVDFAETARDVSFCAHAISQDDVLEIPDPRNDPRFRDNPLVTGEPNFRFYAGAPLVTPDTGHRIGTLCVLDRTPRTLTAEQRKALGQLARQVVSQLELRKLLRHTQDMHAKLEREIARRQAGENALRLSERFMRATIDAMQDTIAIVDHEGVIMHVNNSWRTFAENNGGAQLMPKVGPGVDYIEVCERAARHGSKQGQEVADALRKILARSIDNYSLEYPCHAPQERRWFSLRITSFGKGADTHAVIVHRNISDRRKSEQAIRELNESLEERVKRRTQELERAYRSLSANEEQLRSSEQQLRALTKRLEQVREEERNGISREIHDELGQMLTALKIDITLLERDLPNIQPDDTGAISTSLHSMSELVDMTIDSVRSISRRLRPEVLDALGLVPAIEWHAGEFEQRSTIRCKVIADDDQPRLDVEQRSALFRIAQEAMTNVARHADASEIEIRAERRDGQLVLEISDNGRGINPADLVGTSSLGVVGMRERATMIGADFRIGSDGRNKGTTVTVQLPLDNKDNEDNEGHQDTIS